MRINNTILIIGGIIVIIITTAVVTSIAVSRTLAVEAINDQAQWMAAGLGE